MARDLSLNYLQKLGISIETMYISLLENYIFLPSREFTLWGVLSDS